VTAHVGIRPLSVTPIRLRKRESGPTACARAAWIATGELSDTDKDNYPQDCLFSTANNVPASACHLGRVQVLFGDGHVRACSHFLPDEMTHAYDRAGANWGDF